MPYKHNKPLNFAAAIAVGLATALLVREFAPNSSALLAALPAAAVLLTYASLSRPQPARILRQETGLQTLNQCYPPIAAAGIGAWLWDTRSGEFSCTKEVLKILGMEEGNVRLTMEALKASAFRDDRELLEQAIDGVTRGLRRSPFDCRFVRSDHSIVWVELTMCTVDADGSGLKLGGAMTDVTERKHVEADLDRGSAYLEAILESTDDVVFTVDRGMRLVVVNHRFVKEMRAAFGVTLEVGDDLAAVCPMDLVEVWKPRFSRVLAGQSLQLDDVFLVRGRRHHFNVSLKPIRENGYINGVAAYGRNTTAQRQRERELRKAKEQAIESDRLKSAFLANMSHEIRTPLNAVMGFAQLLKSETLTQDERERFIEVILSNGNHLLHIIGDIIDLAQIESGQLRIEPGFCDLRLLMTETYSVFYDRIRVQSQDLVELLVKKSAYREQYIVCDQVRLKQVIYNLVSNAMKFTLQGSITVGYQRMPGNMIEFHVADTGTGILPEMKQQVFQRFRQAADQTGRINDGVGLGLSICEGLVKLLGGQIWIEDNKPHGSLLKFTIRDYSDVMPLPRNEASATDNSARPNKSRSKMKVLVAEDDDTNFQVLEEFLRFDGLDSIRAVNGREAIELLKRHDEIGLVFMDLSMPVMDGLKATRAMKKLKPEVPIIAHTAHAMKPDLEKALEAGCSDYLVKPISIESFRAVLDQYV